MNRYYAFGSKDKYISFILCFFAGVFGAHKFYLGRKKTGFIYLLTFGALGLGWMYDLILMSIFLIIDKINPPCNVIEISENEPKEDLFTLKFDNLLSEIDSLQDGFAFEQYCGKLLEQNGYSDVQVTKSSGDYGIDIIALRDGVEYAIQCKLYSTPVGNSAIQEAVSGRTYYNCHVAAVLTNSTFTRNAKILADSNNILLWDRDCLKQLIQNAQNANQQNLFH